MFTLLSIEEGSREVGYYFGIYPSPFHSKESFHFHPHKTIHVDSSMSGSCFFWTPVMCVSTIHFETFNIDFMINLSCVWRGSYSQGYRIPEGQLCVLCVFVFSMKC